MQFRRRLLGFSPASVARAFRQLQSQHEAELERLRHELAEARARVRELWQQLDRIEAQIRDVQDGIQAEIVRTIQVQSQGQQALQEAAVRHGEQREQFLRRIREREAVLGQVEELRMQFAARLAELAEQIRAGLPQEDPGRVAATGPRQPGREAGPAPAEGSA